VILISVFDGVLRPTLISTHSITMVNTSEEIRTGGEALNASKYISSLNHSTSNFSLPMESLFAGEGEGDLTVVSTQEIFKLTREHHLK